MRKYGANYKEKAGQQFRPEEVSDAAIILLAEAIMQDAVKVYTSAKKKIERLKNNPAETWTSAQWERWRKCCREITEIEKFFTSQYGEMFLPTNYDGRSILRMLNEKPPTNPNRKPCVRHQRAKSI